MSARGVKYARTFRTVDGWTFCGVELRGGEVRVMCQKHYAGLLGRWDAWRAGRAWTRDDASA